MSSVSWTFNLSVLNGQNVSLSNAITVDAIDSIAVAIPNDTDPHEIQVTALTSTDDAIFFIISSSQYDQTDQSPPGGAFTYTVTVGATTSPATGGYTLDGPQFLTSRTLVGLLVPVPSGTTSPTAVYLTFTNKTSAPANVTILVGRKAS